MALHRLLNDARRGRDAAVVEVDDRPVGSERLLDLEPEALVGGGGERLAGALAGRDQFRERRRRIEADGGERRQGGGRRQGDLGEELAAGARCRGTLRDRCDRHGGPPTGRC